MNILIVGKNSFIGQSVGAWFTKKNPCPIVSYVSVRDDGWKTQDFSGFDTVIFTAALVHRPDVTDWAEYERINVRLPYEFAKYVKTQGVRHFVFLSSVSVYESGRTLPEGRVISPCTPLEPDTMYGKSKRVGELLIQTLMEEKFLVSVIRPTYVYGKGCRGRHIEVLKMLASFLPVLPKAYENVKMGMVYVDNLSELCWLVVNSGRSGVYHAQDRDPMSTYEVLRAVSEAVGTKKSGVSCTWLFKLFEANSLVVRLFGGSAYTEELARCELGEYQHVTAAEGIAKTVGRNIS